MPVFSRVILIVLDSAGIGELPDARAYGDEGSNTLGNLARQVPLAVPTLRSMGLGHLVDLGRPPEAARGAYGRMAEASKGKDSVTGHWEMMGVVLERAFPTFPSGFPDDVIREFERRIGRSTLGNVVASGTEVIDRYAEEHLRTGSPIVYTSADSVFQIAAHEDVIPVPELYRICKIAFDLVGRGMNVGRVIARPFIGTQGAFKRTANRHDYALEPTGDTLLDLLMRDQIPVFTIGKVKDLFSGRGISGSVTAASDAEGMDRLAEALRSQRTGLIFINLVDFDAVYGHRNDVAGYAANLERFDERLSTLLPMLDVHDLLILTADHGNDPTTPSTDHSREFVPLLMTGARVPPATNLRTRATFADLGQTLAENFDVGPLAHGTSFLESIVVHHS